MAAKSGRSWTKLGGLVALGYYALAITTLLLEYLSESSKLSRGMYTDTFNPLVVSELVTWPSSVFVADWQGYPQSLDQSTWQKALNDSLPSHIWAVVVQAILVFLIIKALSMALGLKRSDSAADRRSSG
ncbi:MAG TPA: hypothetical protein VGX49_05910 [Jatrophihabitans sp.]|jgi:hypothetical protein|nr:hypothetical protein [Jatrophihabitans sp.]